MHTRMSTEISAQRLLIKPINYGNLTKRRESITMANGTSLLEQNEELKKKWGGDTLHYDAQGALAKGEISQKDYADYLNDLKYIQSVDALNNNYTNIVNQAKQTENQKLQYTDTRRQLMEKYLPETLMAQGVANTGYTADTLLKAENNYNQYVMGAMNDRANTEQNAMQSYQTALRDYQMNKAETEYQNFIDEQGRKTEDRYTGFAENALKLINEGADIDYIKAQAAVLGITEDLSALEEYNNKLLAQKRDDVYNTYSTLIQQGSKDITRQDIISDVKNGYLRPSEANRLMNGMPMSAWDVEGEITKSKDELNSMVTIKYNGTKYNMEIEEENTDPSFRLFANSYLKDGDIFIEGNTVYIYKYDKIYKLTSYGSLAYKNDLADFIEKVRGYEYSKDKPDAPWSGEENYLS